MESAIPIESPVGASVLSSGLSQPEGRPQQPKCTRVAPIDSQRYPHSLSCSSYPIVLRNPIQKQKDLEHTSKSFDKDD